MTAESDTPNYVNCGKCGFVISESVGECCWFCTGWMCSECWDIYGHCGHKEADLIVSRIKDAGTDGCSINLEYKETLAPAVLTTWVTGDV